MSNAKKHVVVVGLYIALYLVKFLLIIFCSAGVTGLQTAISLLEAGYEVTIKAKHFPGDQSIEYTSPW